jgi:hypothetical protein
MIAQIVDELQPEQVWLFGSRARGEARTDSDWDLMAILPDRAPEQDRRREAVSLPPSATSKPSIDSPPPDDATFTVRASTTEGMRSMIAMTTALALVISVVLAIEDMVEGCDLGSLVTWSVGVSTGYRLVILDRVEITPSIGTALVVEGGLDGMSRRPRAPRRRSD